MPVPPMDVFGIVYIIENAQQFWSELEDILILPKDLTLSKLDAMLRRFVSFCAAYHGAYYFHWVSGARSRDFAHVVCHAEQYLQSPLQLEHACDILLASELFAFHSERMCELLVEDAQTVRPIYTSFSYSH
ncbi:hypothetical protein A0H81_03038 [Grifola frondosa]|uniref:Uncharacterized protein n=1 Tax=Grifola frondosa TaxID=5627 RepID=A0A1C7MKD6_GRIFR|nr:hypothetical protein A0H81_03038 [Grifola frondosa]